MKKISRKRVKKRVRKRNPGMGMSMEFQPSLDVEEQGENESPVEKRKIWYMILLNDQKLGEMAFIGTLKTIHVNDRGETQYWFHNISRYLPKDKTWVEVPYYSIINVAENRKMGPMDRKVAQMLVMKWYEAGTKQAEPQIPKSIPQIRKKKLQTP